VFIKEFDRFDYANFIERLAGLYGRRTAFVLDRPIEYPGFSGTVLSYRDVDRLVSRMAVALRRLGVERGDRVGLITMNRVEMAFCNFAAGRIGAIPVPMNFMLRPNEIEHVMATSEAELLVCDPSVFASNVGDPSAVPSVKRWAVVGSTGEPPEPCVDLRRLMEDAPDHLPPVSPASLDEVALLFFTSGTTGLPKGAVLTHEAAMVYARHHGRAFAARPRMPRGLALMVMPVAHAGGYAALMTQLLVGTPAYFMSRFDPQAILKSIQTYRPTIFAGSPAMFRMLLDAGAERYDLTPIRVWAGGADAFSDELVSRFRELAARPGPLPGLKRKPLFIRGYGMAETNSYVSQIPFEAGDNCLGWVLPPVRFRIVDEECQDVPRGRPGELLLAGPNVMKGYWRDEEATASAFTGEWFHTSDVVRQGKWRMLYFVGRSNDIIKSGGYKISANEIDQVLTQHPDVEHAATVGVPDPVKGERPMAAVVLRRGAEAGAEDILEWARDRLAPYKCPRRIVVMPDLPFTFSLKPKRREVRERLLALTAAEEGEPPTP